MCWCPVFCNRLFQFNLFWGSFFACKIHLRLFFCLIKRTKNQGCRYFWVKYMLCLAHKSNVSSSFFYFRPFSFFNCLQFVIVFYDEIDLFLACAASIILLPKISKANPFWLNALVLICFIICFSMSKWLKHCIIFKV